MSFTQQPQTSADNQADPKYALAFVGVYVIPVLVIIGVFVLIAIGKLNAETGITLISVIAGVHGGATVTNAAKS